MVLLSTVRAWPASAATSPRLFIAPLVIVFASGNSPIPHEMPELLEGYSHGIYGLPVVRRGAACCSVREFASNLSARFAGGGRATAVRRPAGVRVDFFRR